MVRKEDLLKTLEGLRDEEFVDFKWHLMYESLEGYQTITESQLNNAKRRDTVDVMVKTYQLPGAVEATKELLKMINRNDLLPSLSDSNSGPEVDVSADLEASENRGPSSCQTHPLLEVSTISSHSEDNINDKESSENRGPSPFQPLTDNSQSEATTQRDAGSTTSTVQHGSVINQPQMTGVFVRGNMNANVNNTYAAAQRDDQHGSVTNQPKMKGVCVKGNMNANVSNTYAAAQRDDQHGSITNQPKMKGVWVKGNMNANVSNTYGQPPAKK